MAPAPAVRCPPDTPFPLPPTPTPLSRVPGEDPTLTSEFAFRYVSGLQGGPDDRYKKIVSTCKASGGAGG